ncbi:MAG: hypothetical protein PHG27_09800 [Massilibacteroides sp.]|nr:hypothetical protein [Massilibacteroides sp.]
MRVKGTENCATIECVDRYKNIWRVRYDFKDDIEDGIKVGVTYEEIEFPHKLTLDDLKDVRAKEVELANNEAERFYINGLSLWLNKELRNSLLNVTLPTLVASGVTETLLWYEGKPSISLTVPIPFLTSQIPNLEIYAKQVYDNTQRLIAEIYNASTEEELCSIAITGYPAPLTFNL